MSCDAPLCEPVEIPDIYVSGLADIERLECGSFRFTLYVEKRSIITREKAREVVARIVMAAFDVSEALQRTKEFLDPYSDEVGKRILSRMN